MGQKRKKKQKRDRKYSFKKEKEMIANFLYFIDRDVKCIFLGSGPENEFGRRPEPRELILSFFHSKFNSVDIIMAIYQY